MSTRDQYEPLTARQTLARMKKGDVVCDTGGPRWAAFESDGARVRKSTLIRLVGIGEIDPPQYASVHAPYTLKEPS